MTDDQLGTERRRALLVATGRYRHDSLPDLDSPTMDSQVAAQVLGDPQLGRFSSVEAVTDADSRQVMEACYEFFAAAQNDEFLLAYFSGHGRREGHTGRLYLATIDTDPDRLPVSALPAEFLREMMDACNARRVVLVLDCCHAGAFSGEPRQRQRRERVVILSAATVQRAHEGGRTPGEAKPSAFAGAFFEGIRSGLADTDDNGWITVREAFDYAVARLREFGVEQHPQMRAGIMGDLVLSRAPVVPGRLPPEVSSLLRNSLPAARRVAVDELAGWLVSGDASRSEPAEQALAALRTDPDERVAQSATRVLAQRGRTSPRATLDLLPALPGHADPFWFRRAVCYEVRVRTFSDSNGDGVGDLPGLASRLDYLQWLGVGCLLLAPIYDSPLVDDGYDAMNLTAVHPDLGTATDLIELIDAAHRRNIRVVLDLVLNHTSDRHPWFQASRSDPEGPFGDFYVWSKTDDWYAAAAVADTAVAESHWTFDPVRKQFYWHRFGSCEPDLNYDSPGVQDAMLAVIRFWLDLGVDGYRLVTAPYLYEREGLLSEGLDETHTYLRRIRKEIDAHYPGRTLMAAADHWPADAGAYFGDAEHPECSVVLHASLAPRIFLAMRRQSHAPVSGMLAQAAPIPDGCQWGLYLRNGDEMSLDLLSEDDRAYLLREYAPQRRMRTAGGIRRRLAPLLDGNRSQVEFCLALLLSLPGSPVLYYGDEIGMGENLMLPGYSAVRTPMQWTAERTGGFSAAEHEQLAVPTVLNAAYGYQATNVEAQAGQTGSLLRSVRRLIDIRRNSTALMTGSYAEVPSGNTAVLAYLRTGEKERMLCVANFSRYPQATALELAAHAGIQPVEAAGGARFPPVGTGAYPLSLAGYGFLWFRLAEAAA